MLETGQEARVTRSFSAADVAEYVALGGAVPPAGKVAEPLVGALFSYLLGVHLPGVGTNYLRQRTRFVRLPDTDTELTATVLIVRIRADKQLADLSTRCRDASGAVICDGEALVYTGDVEA